MMPQPAYMHGYRLIPISDHQKHGAFLISNIGVCDQPTHRLAKSKIHSKNIVFLLRLLPQESIILASLGQISQCPLLMDTANLGPAVN
jgi:hypothetical protein